eukprot:m.140520 g.140520  ORF g.140520 m.140520 type:complete len:88 (+) comp52571_c0_seq11:86-349(+)
MATYVGERNAAQEAEGSGTETYANGDSFTGRFLANQKSGPGVYTYANGDRFASGFITVSGAILLTDQAPLFTSTCAPSDVLFNAFDA